MQMRFSNILIDKFLFKKTKESPRFRISSSYIENRGYFVFDKKLKKVLVYFKTPEEAVKWCKEHKLELEESFYTNG